MGGCMGMMSVPPQAPGDDPAPASGFMQKKSN